VVPGGSGGIHGLCELVDEYGAELRGDFQEFFQLDLVDVWRGTLTPRRVFDLAGSLYSIPRSRYRAKALGDDRWLGWSAEAAVLADIYDAERDSMVKNLEVWGGKATAKPYPRPENTTPAVAEPAKPVTIAEFPIWETVRAFT
jgi:hypothetical protein